MSSQFIMPQIAGTGEPASLWFMFYQGMLIFLKKREGKRTLPVSGRPPFATPYLLQDCGSYRGIPCKAAALAEPPAPGGPADAYPLGLPVLADLREGTYELLGEQLYALAGRARQLAYWDLNSQYCGLCGSKTVLAFQGCKKCPHCGNEIFPTLSVAILAVVIKRGASFEEDSILLVRSHNIAGPYHVLISGFVEPGETLEQCVRREVLEETGLVVDNIRYFGSQPWPHPNNLMAGFFADYKSGEIVIQQEELKSGAFYKRGEVPMLPHEFSLARRMADWWIREREMPTGREGLPYAS